MIPSQPYTVVIPCFNEQAAIGFLVREIQSFLPSVIVVDDGSEDGTAADARLAGATVLSHPQRIGKGAALMTGLARARQLGFTHALCMDGDGQHAPSDIAAFIECHVRNSASLIIGNRMDHPEEMPWLRRAVNHTMSRMISMLCGQFLPDTQCGFRLVNLQLLRNWQPALKHFDFESEMLFEVLRAGATVEFVPVKTIYRNESSKINPFADTLRWLRWFATALTLSVTPAFKAEKLAESPAASIPT